MPQLQGAEAAAEAAADQGPRQPPVLQAVVAELEGGCRSELADAGWQACEAVVTEVCCFGVRQSCSGMRNQEEQGE